MKYVFHNLNFIDVPIAVYIFKEEQRQIKLENEIASKFHCRSSLPTRDLREMFDEVTEIFVLGLTCFLKPRHIEDFC